MQELDSQIADVDQKLAAQTRMLLSINEETGRAQKDEMELKAEVPLRHLKIDGIL